MQLQFEKKEIPCLHTVKREVQSQEQTQELRISDGMPDIGSIVGAWGQVILRSKEWQENGMTVSGGTMVWVQYLPEEGGGPQCVESWLPFQMRWNFPGTKNDGKIMTQCILRSVDARSTSARKMMLRTNVSVLGWAMENEAFTVYEPADLPEDIYLKKVKYPIQLPAEAGEKAFALEESLSLPPSVPKLESLVSYCVHPQINEEKLMNDKVVFRGNAVLHILYMADDGGQYAWDFDIPFTQYAELEKEYGEDGEVLLLPCVTALELEREENTLGAKIGLVCQYQISHRPVVEVIEDSYGIKHKVEPILQDLSLPGILERKTQSVHAQSSMPVDAMRLTDVGFVSLPAHTNHGGENTAIEIPGQFHLFYYDMEGIPRSAVQKWEQSMNFPLGENVAAESIVLPTGKTQGTLMSGSAQLSSEMTIITETTSDKAIPMVTGLELGEAQTLDPNRPSLILRRSGGKTLWELAKSSGSSEDVIRKANNLQAEPEESQMLLIPVF